MACLQIVRGAEQHSLLGLAFLDRQLVRIDAQSAQTEVVAELSPSFLPMDMAFRGDQLYAFSLGRIENDQFTLDPEQLGVFALAGASGVVVDAASFEKPWRGAEGGLAFRDDGIGYVSFTDDAVGTLARFNLDDGTLESVSAENALAPSIDGLAFGSDGTLYGISQGPEPDLYRLNQDTGAQNWVGSLGVRHDGTTVAGLAFSPEGTLYAILGGPNDSRLYTVDTDTGQAQLVGTSPFARISGIAFVPPSSPPPRLEIQARPDDILLSWPSGREQTLLSAPEITGPWVPFSAMTTTNEGRVELLVAPEEPRRFFQFQR